MRKPDGHGKPVEAQRGELECSAPLFYLTCTEVRSPRPVVRFLRIKTRIDDAFCLTTIVETRNGQLNYFGRMMEAINAYRGRGSACRL